MGFGPGSAIRIDNRRYVVSGVLGEGGEGTVYELSDESGRPQLAVKWYHEGTAIDQRRAVIGALVERGSPSDRFLWPMGIIEDGVTARFGYVMPLRPPGYASLGELLRGDIPREEHKVLRFAYELAWSFLALHSRGLCYRDINFGNAFFDPTTGRALICDNDNVGIDGVSRAMVIGSRKFMAPEIVRREAMPSKRTDQYSLAVMLSYLLLVHHPLEGRSTELGIADGTAYLKHYGYEPLFCFDPNDDSNRPHPEYHAHVPLMWAIYPPRIRQLFTRAFTAGLHDPAARVVDSEWCDALALLRDTYHPCLRCGWPRFFDADQPFLQCARCGHRPDELTLLRVGRHAVVVGPNATVTRHHLAHDFDFETLVGMVEAHPTKSGLLGFRNMTGKPLTYRRPNGSRADIPPGRRGGLVHGASIVLEGVEAHVEVLTHAAVRHD